MSFIYTAYCRLRQAALRAGQPRRIERQAVEEGTGAVFSVAQLLRANHLHKPIVVAAHGAEKVRERVLHALEENDLTWTEWELPERTLTAADADSAVAAQRAAVGDGAVYKPAHREVEPGMRGTGPRKQLGGYHLLAVSG